MRVEFLCFCFLAAVYAVAGQKAPLRSSVTYEFDEYSCETQIISAVLSVFAKGEDGETPVLSLTSVLDISGSMDDSHEKQEGERTKMELLQATNNFLVERLARESGKHKFGIVSFSTDVRTLSPLQTLTTEKAPGVQKKINGTTARGGTNLLAGILKGIQQQRQDEKGGFIRAVFVFTDGAPSVGERSDTRIIARVKAAVDAAGGDVLVYTFGYGSALKFDLLNEIANVGGGVFYLISREKDIPEAFGAALGGLLTEVATKLKFTIKAKEGAEIVDVLHGHTDRRSADQIDVFLGDLFEEERRDIVIQTRVTETCDAFDLIDVEETFVDAISFEKKGRKVPTVPVTRSPNVPTLRDEVTDVGVHVLRYEIADELKIAAGHLKDGNVDACITKVHDLETRLGESGYIHHPFIEAVHADVKKFRKDLESEGVGSTVSRATLDGIIDAVEKQRTGLTDADAFETVEITTTMAKQEIGDEAAREVLQEEVIHEFRMGVKHAVGATVRQGDFVEIDVVVSITPPVIQSYSAPLSVTTVLDKSGSMRGRPFMLLIKTQKHLIDELLKEQATEIELGIILFSDEAATVQELDNIMNIDIDGLKADLDQQRAEGKTALGTALSMGVEQQVSNPKCAGTQVVYLMTDGKPTDSDAETIARDLEEQLTMADYPVSVYVFALGEFDEDLLKTVAEEGNGQMYYLFDEHDIGPSFGNALGGLLSAKAKDIEIKIKAGDASVEIVDIFPKQHKTSNETHKIVFFPNLFEEESRDVFLKVRAPRQAVPDLLLEVDVSYTDIITCGKSESGVIEILSKKTGSITKRLLEKEVVRILEQVVVQCVDPSAVDVVIDALSEAIEFVAGSPSFKGSYQTDLQSDLVSIRSSFQDYVRPYQLFDACTRLKVFIDVLVTQRTKGTGRSDLLVEASYDTGKAKQEEAEFLQGIAGTPERPTDDPFSVSYHQALEEISSDAQNITIPMLLKAIPKPEGAIHATVVFIVDGSASITAAQIQDMQTLVVKTWTAFSQSDIFERSSIGIIVHGEGIETKLELMHFSDVTVEQLEAIFTGLAPAGTGDFMSAVEEGFSVLGSVSGLEDKIMVVFHGASLDGSTSASDATKFNTLVRTLDYPLTFIPVLFEETSHVEYDAFPPWVKSSVIQHKDTDTTFEHIKPALFSRAAKRIKIGVTPNENVTLISVEGSHLTDTGHHLITDVDYSKDKIVPIHLSVKEHNGTQILVIVSFTYYDMRSFYTWEKANEPFAIRRVDPETLIDMIDVRNDTKFALKKIEDALVRDAHEDALELTSHGIAVVIRKKYKHSEVDEIHDRLKGILKRIHSIIDGEATIDEALKLIRSLRQKCDVRAQFIPKAKKSRPLKRIEPYEYVPVLPPKPVEQFVVDFENAVPILNTTDTVTVSLTFEAPPYSGQMVDAHVTFIIDASAGSDQALMAEMVKALLLSLAGRRGVRSVDIFSWKEELMPIYQSEDFNKSQIDEAMEHVHSVMPEGTVNYSVVLEDGITKSQTTDATIPVMYWIVTSDMAEGETPEDLYQTASASLQDGASPLTVMTFGSGIKQGAADLLNRVSQLSGGKAFVLDQAEAPACDKTCRMTDVARNAVNWIDGTFSKNVMIHLTPMDGVLIQSVDICEGDGTVMESNTVRVASHPYRGTISLKVGIQFGLSPVTRVIVRRLLENNQDLMQLLVIDGTYYNLRKQQTEAIAEDALSVELVDQKTLDRMQLLDDLLADVGDKMMVKLGKNQLDNALLAVTQSHVLSTHSGIKSRADVQEAMSRYEKIENELEQFVKHQDIQSVQKATDRIEKLNADKPYTSDMGNYLMVKHSGISATEEATLLNFTIKIDAPEMATEDVEKHMTVSVVFDAVDYETLIEGEEILDVQKKTARALLIELVKHQDYKIRLIAIGDRYSGHTELLPLDLNKGSIETELDDYFDHITANGQSAGSFSGLERGLMSLEDVSDSERLVLHFSGAPSTCLIGGPQDMYEANLLVKYITYPINPVKVMTYIVGPAELSKVDTVSGMTRGSRHHIHTISDVHNAVMASAEHIKDTSICSVQLEILPEKWHKRDVQIEGDGYLMSNDPKWTAALKDMKAGASQSVDLSLRLDKWNGDADLFQYSVSYFRSDHMRWYKTPYKTFRVKRAPENVLKERAKQKSNVERALGKVMGDLAHGDITGAVNAVQAVLTELDASPYKDDSIIHTFLVFLSKVYKSIKHLSKTETDQYVNTLSAETADNDLDVTIEDAGSDFDVPVSTLVFFVSLFVAVVIVLFIGNR